MIIFPDIEMLTWKINLTGYLESIPFEILRTSSAIVFKYDVHYESTPTLDTGVL